MESDIQRIVPREGSLQEVETEDSKARNKEPQRIIHFANGETMEEYSTDEEIEEEQKATDPVNPSELPWRWFLWFRVTQVARISLFTCDFLGEKLASLLGLTSAKYQYAIDEYHTVQNQIKEEDEDGEEMAAIENPEMNHEKRPLPLHSVEYGTITEGEKLRDGSDSVNQRAVAFINEAVEADIESSHQKGEDSK
ncbi:protein FAM177A1 [Callorhinchus milii]|uniref:protein FAM177A1 n=1 Tax=Callorhinchus milii TaxID=7868 RepID=UPI001C3FC6A8|nr:protein FAM177A1 [Callorhinchus milii]